MSVEEVTKQVQGHRVSRVCLTGGEPLAQKDVHKLIQKLIDANYFVSIETSGAISIEGSVPGSGNDTWSEPVNLGPAINQPAGREWSASVSPDGKYLFFMSSREDETLDLALTGRSITELLELSTRPGLGSSDIWWVSADVIEDLRP